MKVTHILFSLLTLSVPSVWAVSYDADQKIETPLVLDGEYVVEVASGVTVEFSGEISGTGPLRKTGAGTLVLSNGNNTFTEGVQISQGYVRADKEGCLGDGKVYIDGTVKSSQGTLKNYGVTRQICFNAADATFANAIDLTGKEPDTQAPLIRAMESVVLAGPVAFNTAIAGNCYLVFRSDSGKVLRFTGGVIGSATYFRPYVIGEIWFDCTFSLPATVSCPGSENYPSDLKFGGKDGHFNVLSMKCNAVRFTSENAITSGVVTVSSKGNYTDTTKTRLDLDGWSQRFSALDFNTTQDKSPASGYDGTWIYTDPEKPATLTLIGAASNYTGWQRLCGALSFVVDAAGYPNFVQTLSYRPHSMTGVLAVSNGTLVVDHGATFKNVPEVHVGPNGALQFLDSTSALSGATKVVVDGTLDLSGATTSLPSDNSIEVWLGASASLKLSSNLRVKNLYIWNGETYERKPNADYKAGSIAQITGGDVNVDNGEEELVDATWTAGAGASAQGIAEAANWSVAAEKLNLSNGKLGATFASAGATAEIDRAVKFRKVTFDAADGFTLAKANGSAAVEIGGEGIVASAGAYEIAAPVTLPVAQTWMLGSGATVRISDGVSVDPAVVPDVAGAGAFELSGESVFGNGAAISNRTVCLSGLIATPDRVPDGPAAYWSDATGWTPYESALRVYANVWGEDSSVSISNLVSEKALWIRGPGNATSTKRSWFNVAPGSTNEFRAGVYFSSDIGSVTVPSDACLCFRKGLNLAATTRWTGGTLDFQGGTFGAGTGSGVYLTDVNIRLHGAGGDGKYRMESGSSFDCFCDLAITNAYLWFNASTRVSLHGHVIHAKQMERNWGWPTIESDEPATLVVGYDKNGTASSFMGQINGCVSVVKNGAGGTLTISDCAAATTGDLSVVGTGNVLTLAADASWLNGTNVTVASTSTLKLQGRRQFNSKFAVLHIDDSGIVDLAEGTTQRFHEMYVDGVKVEPGIYGSADVEGVDHTYAAHFTGLGRVKVGDFGAVLIVR